MDEKFDKEEAKRFLQAKELQAELQKEEQRKMMLHKAIAALQEMFRGSSVEVYLVGSVTRPGSFSERSDIDVVLKNYTGDRFDVWTQLENIIGRGVEIILFESCHFQDFVLKEGLKVV